MNQRDFYNILGISDKASPDDIKKAYRGLAKKYHPDRNKGDKASEEKFKNISEAYEILGDPKKRAQYDEFKKYGGLGGNFGSGNFSGGASGFPGGGQFNWSDVFSGGQGNYESAQGSSSFGFEDILGSFFEGGGFANKRHRAPQRGRDIKTELVIPFEIAAKGGSTEVNISTPDGLSERLKVKIPKAVEEGTQIRLTGKGQASRGGKSGDLLLNIKIAPHPNMSREGLDLVIPVGIDAFEAMLGAKKTVNSLSGSISLKIPAGVQHGSRLKVKGWGLEDSKGKKGDLLAEMKITIPNDLSEDQIELIKKAWELSS